MILVAISKAAPIEVQNLPICGMFGYLSMFFKASLRATSGVTPPFVAISKAAPIEVQNLPICGMFGITTPFSEFS